MFTYSFKSTSQLTRIVISHTHIYFYTQPNNIEKLQSFINELDLRNKSIKYDATHPFAGFVHFEFLSFNKLNDSSSCVQLKLTKKNRANNLKEIFEFLSSKKFFPEQEIEKLLRKFQHFTDYNNMNYFITKITEYTEKIDLKISQCNVRSYPTNDDNALFDYYLYFFRLQEALLGIQHNNWLYWHWQALHYIHAILQSNYSGRFNLVENDSIAFYNIINALLCTIKMEKNRIINQDLSYISMIACIGYACTEQLTTNNNHSLTLMNSLFKHTAILGLTAKITYQATRPLRNGFNCIYAFFTKQNKKNHNSLQTYNIDSDDIEPRNNSIHL